MKEYLDEDEKTEELKRMVDELCEKIKNGEFTLGEAREEITLIRLKAQELIPFEMDKFDLIYMARFNRLIEQYLLPRLKDDSAK
jgi:hypothetical protein